MHDSFLSFHYNSREGLVFPFNTGRGRYYILIKWDLLVLDETGFIRPELPSCCPTSVQKNHKMRQTSNKNKKRMKKLTHIYCFIQYLQRRIRKLIGQIKIFCLSIFIIYKFHLQQSLDFKICTSQERQVPF